MISDALKVEDTLALHRCPHCQIARPLLCISTLYQETINESAIWAAYVCSNCKNVVTAKGHVIHNGKECHIPRRDASPY